MPKGIEPSNLEKVFWPDEGVTKGDLMSYFDAVAPFILPTLRARPLTLKRYPDGIDGFAFYQKNAPTYTPEWVETITLHAGSAKRDVRYILCNSKRTLMWLANQAAIELHPWLSRADRLERPDHLVLDLDPPEGRFDRAVEIAMVVKDVLDGAGLAAVAKTSGAKGIHVYVPLARRHSYGETRLAAERLTSMVADVVPDLATTEFKIADRGGRLFLDAGRNAPGAHVVAPYSPRARPGATVSFPIEWSELARVSPRAFTLSNAPALLGGEDRWKALMPPPQRLPRALLH